MLLRAGAATDRPDASGETVAQLMSAQAAPAAAGSGGGGGAALCAEHIAAAAADDTGGWSGALAALSARFLANASCVGPVLAAGGAVGAGDSPATVR